jgi:hypothetical protein
LNFTVAFQGIFGSFKCTLGIRRPSEDCIGEGQPFKRESSNCRGRVVW